MVLLLISASATIPKKSFSLNAFFYLFVCLFFSVCFCFCLFILLFFILRQELIFFPLGRSSSWYQSGHPQAARVAHGQGVAQRDADVQDRGTQKFPRNAREEWAGIFLLFFLFFIMYLFIFVFIAVFFFFPQYALFHGYSFIVTFFLKKKKYA